MLCGGLTIALDVTEDVAEVLVDSLVGVVPGFKVGMTLYGEGGNQLVNSMVDRKCEVFLDLKFHDIPHQVAGAVKRVCDLGVSLCTVHTAGGPRMLEAAARASEGYGTKVLGVTVLTSLSAEELSLMGVRGPLEWVVEERARMAHDCGLAGIVCSPLELRVLRDAFPRPFSLVTPGIRDGHAIAGDQKRVLTGEEAVRRGSDLLVVGRPVTEARDPVKAAMECMTWLGGR